MEQFHTKLMIIKNLIKILLMTIIGLCNLNCAFAFQVKNLQTEYRVNPMGIDSKCPHFSWQLLSEKRGIIQKNYRIYIRKESIVSEIIYDSGYVEDSTSTNVVLKDFLPEPCTRYYWTVEVTNTYDESVMSKENSFFETGLLGTDWDGAKWISVDSFEDNYDKSSPLFRKDFNLDSKIRKARLYTSALGVYTLYVNGVRVGEKLNNGEISYDELMPGWTDYRKTIFYMTHDVTDLLKTGKNVIGAEVCNGWWKGRISGGIYNAQKVAFIGKLVVELENGSIITIKTNTDWHTSEDGPVLSSDIYDGEVYDARRYQNWTDPAYDCSSWIFCKEDTQPKGKLYAFTGPTIRVRPELERRSKTIKIYEGIINNGTTYGEINISNINSDFAPVILKKGQTMIVDFGQNASGWVKIHIRGERGTSIKIRYAEMINDSGDSDRGNDGPKGSLYTSALRSAKACCEYILKGEQNGEIYVPTSVFFGFRYCDINTSDNIIIESISAETISSLNHENSRIVSNNEDVNKLFSNIQWGQYSNFLSVPMDCPQRDERWGWTADTQVFSMTACYNSNVQGFYHKWLQDMRDGQLQTGEYPNTAPLVKGAEHYGASAWADAGIILPWNVYMMYGDTAIIEENYESMRNYMNWITKQKEDGYTYSGARATYGDWLAFEETENQFVSTAYYAYLAELMGKMSHVLSTRSKDYYDIQAQYYETLYKKIKEEFILRYWDKEGHRLIPSSQCALLMALKYNLLPDDDAIKSTKNRLREVIESNGNKLSTGFLGTAIINQTLSENEMDDLAYNLLLQHDCPSWLYSVDQGATTIWERWDGYTLENGFSKNIGMNSFNHYAYGAVGEWMYRYLAGINPDKRNPGFRHIILKPSFDPTLLINKVDASFASIYGSIKVKWNFNTDQSYEYSVSIPANTWATLTLPIVDSNKILMEDGKDISGSISDYVFSEDSKYITMNLVSGEYNFIYDTQNSIRPTVFDNLDVRISPNPVSDIVNIISSNKISDIEVRDLAGILIASSKNTDNVDISNANTGLYIVIITDKEGKRYAEKIIKK